MDFMDVLLTSLTSLFTGTQLDDPPHDDTVHITEHPARSANPSANTEDVARPAFPPYAPEVNDGNAVELATHHQSISPDSALLTNAVPMTDPAVDDAHHGKESGLGADVGTDNSVNLEVGKDLDHVEEEEGEIAE